MHSFSLLDNTSLKEITNQKAMKTQKLYYNRWPSKDFKWLKSRKRKGNAKLDKAVTSISIHNIPELDITSSTFEKIHAIPMTLAN